MKTWQKIVREEALTAIRLLELVRRKGPISQIELAEQVGLTTATVNGYIKKLNKTGILRSVGHRSNGVGRPQILLDIDRDQNGVIGLGFNYPHIVGGLSDVSEKILERRQVDISDATTLAELEQKIITLVTELMRCARERKIFVHCITFGVNGVLDRVTGRVLNNVNHPLTNGLDLQRVLYPLFGVPVYVVSLMVAAYLGTLTTEDEDENNRVLFVCYDQGIGLVIGEGLDIGPGSFKRDADGISHSIRDIGHVIWKPDGPVCHCGQRGCLEACLGGWSVMRDLGIPEWKELLARCRAGDPQVKAMVSERVQQLGVELGWIFTLYRPCAVRFGGEVADTAEWVFDAFWKGVYQRLGRITESLGAECLPSFSELILRGSSRLANHLQFNPDLLAIVRTSEDDQDFADVRTLAESLK